MHGRYQSRPVAGISNELTKILKDQPTIDLVPILQHELLCITLRNEATEILDFFYPQNGNRDNYTSLVNFALTRIYLTPDLQKFTNPQANSGIMLGNALSRNAAIVLSCVSNEFQSRAFNEGLIQTGLSQFFTSVNGVNIDPTDMNTDPVLVSNYHKIFQAQCRFHRDLWNDTTLVNNSVVDFAIDNFHIQGYRDLLMSMSSENTLPIHQHLTASLINYVSTQARDDFSFYFAVKILEQLFGVNSNDPAKNQSSQLASSDFLRILEIAQTQQAIHAAHLLDFLSKIIQSAGPTYLEGEISEKLATIFPEFDYNNKILDSKTLAGFPLFWNIGQPETALELLVDYFFVDPSLRPPINYPYKQDIEIVVDELTQVEGDATQQIIDWEMNLFGDKPIPADKPSVQPMGGPILQFNPRFCQLWLRLFKTLEIERQKELCEKLNMRKRVLSALALPPTIRNLRTYKTVGPAINGYVLQLFQHIRDNNIVPFPDIKTEKEEHRKWMMTVHDYMFNTIKRAHEEANAQIKVGFNDEEVVFDDKC